MSMGSAANDGTNILLPDSLVKNKQTLPQSRTRLMTNQMLAPLDKEMSEVSYMNESDAIR